MSEEEPKGNRLEEIRAFFVLGLLAVLASVRTQIINVPSKIGTISLNPVIDFTIVFMSLYAICMVFGYSKDLVGKGIASFFRSIAVQFLFLNFVLLAFFGLVYAFALYQSRFIWMVLFIAIRSCYVAYLKIRQWRKKRTKEADVPKLSIRAKLWVLGQTLGGTGVVVCALMISYYAPEQLVWVFFVEGCVVMFEWLWFVSVKPKYFDKGKYKQERLS